MPNRFRFVRPICLLVGLAITLGLVSSPIRAQETTKKEPCFLWKVCSKTNTIYLVGCMHVVKSDIFPLPAEMDDAYAKSRSLVVEVNTEKLDNAVMLKLVQSKGMYPPGEVLSKNVSQKTMDQLREHCAKKSLNPEALEPFRPWMLKMMLGVVELQAHGNCNDGIDKHYLVKASRDKKAILELETAQEQVEFLSGFTPQCQEKLLVKTLADLSGTQEQMKQVAAAWRSGDLKAMEKAMLGNPLKSTPEYKQLLTKMFDERNVKMAKKIEGYLNGNGSCFVVVGAGHLVGERGIIKLLRDKKFQIEQVMRAPAKKEGS